MNTQDLKILASDFMSHSLSRGISDCEKAGEALFDAAQEIDRLRNLLKRLLEEESMHDRGDGNAPGHCHQIPGVWDMDNGKKAGKPCAWCALWAEAKAMILTPNA